MAENGQQTEEFFAIHISMTSKALYKALVNKDSRYDGRVFFGVRTTGIYCRPICPARKPKFQNVIYFKTAAEAQSSGFRACLRCRPESLPGTAAWAGKKALVKRATKLIEGGVYDREGVKGLSLKLGIGERHLRRLLSEELQFSPREMALQYRLKLAQKLSSETQLHFTEIAEASGFKSIRRFNDAFKKRFGITPTLLRKKGAKNAIL